MKHLLSFFFSVVLLFTITGNLFSSDGSNNSVLTSQLCGKNFQKTHHHKIHRLSSIDLSADEDSSFVQNDLAAALICAAVALPYIIKILLAENFINFSLFSSFFRPNLRQHLLLRRLII